MDRRGFLRAYARNAGRLSCCKSVAHRCGLTRADFSVPRRKTDSAPFPSSAR